jgi:hypothetical protein
VEINANFMRDVEQQTAEEQRPNGAVATAAQADVRFGS